MLVTELIHAALKDAMNRASRTASNEGELHRQRSIEWVNALARQFTALFPADFRVFSKYEPSNRADFGLNELLFDVSVCEVARTHAVRNDTELLYVKRGVWQVESELEKNSRAAVRDFSKLVLGSAENKLFAAPVTKAPKAFADALLPVARCCTGRVFLASIPHPADWQTSTETHLFALDTAGWRSGDGETV